MRDCAQKANSSGRGTALNPSRRPSSKELLLLPGIASAEEETLAKRCTSDDAILLAQRGRPQALRLRCREHPRISHQLRAQHLHPQYLRRDPRPQVITIEPKCLAVWCYESFSVIELGLLKLGCWPVLGPSSLLKNPPRHGGGLMIHFIDHQIGRRLDDARQLLRIRAACFRTSRRTSVCRQTIRCGRSGNLSAMF